MMLDDEWIDEPVSSPKEENKKPKTKVKRMPEKKKAKKAPAKKAIKKAPAKKAPAKKKAAKRAGKKIAKPSSISKKVTLNFKVIKPEAKGFYEKADKYTRGNLTQMVRLSVAAWKPSPKDLQGIRKTTRT